MKYILPIILLFMGCFEEKHKEKQIKKIEPKKERNITKIFIKELNLTFEKKTLIYPKKRMVILFDNNSTKCKMQKKALEKLKIKYFKTDNEFLKKYFNITTYPTIIILDKNKTIKYENFTPYEILKEERF